MSTYEIRVDLNDQQQIYLQYLIGITFILGVPAFVLSAGNGPLNIPLGLAILITVIFTYIVLQRKVGLDRQGQGIFNHSQPMKRERNHAHSHYKR